MKSLELVVLLITAIYVDCRKIPGPPQESPFQQDILDSGYLQDANRETTSFRTPEIFDEADEEDIEEIYMDEDIMLTEEQWSALRQRKGLKDRTKRWPEGPKSDDGNHYPLVHYIFQKHEPAKCKKRPKTRCSNWLYRKYCKELCGYVFEAFPDEYKPLVEDAINHWMEHTCIEFKDISNEPESSEQRKQPHLMFDGNRTTCSSFLGMVNYTRYGFPGQKIRAVCPTKTFGSRVHEIGHALGFHHEHRRSDRDDYIKIFEENIPDKWKGRLSPIDDDNMTIEYDYSSVMHYSAYPYSSGNKSNIVPLDPVNLELLGNRTGLSFRDKYLANKMYNCTEKWIKKCQGKKPKTCNEGYIGKNCSCVCPPHKTGEECEMDKPGYNKDYYHDKRTQKLNETITSSTNLSVRVPDKSHIWGSKKYQRDVIFVKTIDPPKCKEATVTFTYSRLNPECWKEFLNIVTNLTDLEGVVLCHKDLSNRATTLKSSKRIIINTIIKIGGPYEVIGRTLWKAEVTFNDRQDCITTSTQQTTTTKSSISDQYLCSTIFTEKDSWTTGLRAELKITFPKALDTWSIKLTFNKDITNLFSGNADSYITSGNTVTLTSKHWNGKQKSGNTLPLDLRIDFSEKPKLISVKLDDVELCKMKQH